MDCETYSVAEAAKVLGIGRITMYQAIRDGTIEALRIGRKPRIVVPRRVVEKMLENPGGIGRTEVSAR